MIHELYLNNYNWLANCELDLIDSLMAKGKEEKCTILYSRNNYGADKKWISKIETPEFKYPVVHSTPKDGHRFIWSNTNGKGFYGIKKVIFGESGIYNPIIDMDGGHAMSQGAMAIVVDNIGDGELLSKFLCSSVFNKVLKACLWSSFRIEWSMFKDFKKDFYKYIHVDDVNNRDEQDDETPVFEYQNKEYKLNEAVLKKFSISILKKISEEYSVIISKKKKADIILEMIEQMSNNIE